MSNNSRITTVTTSMIKSFKSCRKRYFFEYVERLRPRETPKPLSFGSLVHTGLEHLLAGKDMDAVYGEMYAARDESTPILDVDIAFIAVKNFDKYVDWRKWDITQVEGEFCVPCGYAKRLAGKKDGKISHEGKSFLLEHKTCSSPTPQYFHHLMWDEQPTNYLFADAKETGEEVAGIFYNVIAKPTIKRALATPVEKRKYKKDGGLYANMREFDESDEEYLERIEDWYDNPDRFIQHFIYRTARQIKESIKDVNKVIKDINQAERDDTFYPNPNACMILPCPFASLCLEDTPECREGNFSTKSSTAKELETVKF